MHIKEYKTGGHLRIESTTVKSHEYHNCCITIIFIRYVLQFFNIFSWCTRPSWNAFPIGGVNVAIAVTSVRANDIDTLSKSTFDLG